MQIDKNQYYYTKFKDLDLIKTIKFNIICNIVNCFF